MNNQGRHPKARCTFGLELPLPPPVSFGGRSKWCCKPSSNGLASHIIEVIENNGLALGAMYGYGCHDMDGSLDICQCSVQVKLNKVA